ncbi:hypothetical protein MRX96_019000 [Rhipicephalus microplus]
MYQEENARLRWSRSQGKACINHPNASFNGTGPTDKQSDDLTSRGNVAGKKSKRADAAKHEDHKSRKQHNQTSKCLVQYDSSGSVGLAGKQMGSGSVLCGKLKLPFSRVAVRALEGTGNTSKEKEVGSQDGLLNFFDSGTLGLTGSSVDPVKETPTNCRSPAFQVFPESNARSTWSAASWNTSVHVEAVHQTPLSSTLFDSSESTYLGLPSPLAVLSAFVGGHVMERHIRHAWTRISNSSASASGSPSTPSGHQDLDVVRSLGKTSRPLSSRDSVSPELRRNYVRSLSFDHVSFPETLKLTPLEHSFPTGWTREGKPLLKATGQKASGIASQSTDAQQAQVSSYPVGQSCSGFESRRPGATLLTCKRDGAYLKGLLSWNLDPCENFYHFVCNLCKGRGKTIKTNGTAASSDELNHQLEQSVHGVLQRSNSQENLATLKALFYKCMNTRQLDVDDWNPMLELLWLVSLKGFPFSSTPRNSTSLRKIAARVLKMTGAETLLSIKATSHPTKGDTGILSIGMPNMLAPKGSDEAQVTQFYNSTAFACITAINKQRNPTTYSFGVAAFASRLEMLAPTYTVSAGLSPRWIMLLKTQPELFIFVSELFPSSDSPLYSGGFTELHIQSPAFFNALVTLLRNTEHNVVMNYLGIRLMIEVAE